MKKILDPKHLPYFGALVQAVLFSLAGNQFFPAFGWLVGLGVGAVVNYSIALASSRLSDIAEKRKGLARLALIIMLALSPTTITLSFFMPASIFTSIAWSMCVDLSIVLAGAIAGKSLVPQSEPKAKVANRSAKVKGRSKPLSKARADIACRYAPQCDRKFGSQNAANAHARTCGFKPTTVMLPAEQKAERSA